jgi:hypothetical protein
MHWILQNNLFNEVAYQTLLDTLVKFDIPHSIHKVIPFVGELTPQPELNTKNVICMGSYSLRHSARKFGWNPGVFDLEPFDFQHQLKHWGDHMLNSDSQVVNFCQADFGDHEELFLRPIEDSKVFTGKVYDKYDFIDWQKKVCQLDHDYGMDLKGASIQMATLKKIYSEHRFFVVKGKIVTGSTYKLGNSVHYQELQYGNPYQIYAEERIKEWQPHDAFVIDIADTEEGLKIIEINTLNACGYYAADIQKLVMALEDAFNEG